VAALDFCCGSAHALRDNRSNSGWTVRSFVATMYQLGFDFQSGPFNLLVEEVGHRHHPMFASGPRRTRIDLVRTA